MYFECNLDRNVPQYYHPAMYMKLVETINLIHERTDKLNKAISLCSLSGCKTKDATFAKIAKYIFDFSNERFDAMSAEMLATLADQLYDGNDAEERVDWANAEVVFDTAFVTTNDWEALRHVGIGGSDSSVLMGCNPYQSEEGLWYEKLGYPEYISNEGKQIVFDRGHFIEPVVIRTFANLVGAKVLPETRMFRSKKYPVSTANLDGVLLMPNGTLAIFEAKTAVAEKKGEWMGKKVPANYVTQCHQYMAVMDDPRIEGTYIGMIPVADVALDGTYIGSAYADEFFHHFIERDESYEEDILENEKSFWETYVENGIKPERSMNPALDKATREKYEPSPLSDPNITAPELKYEDWKEKLDRFDAAEKAYSEQKKKLDSFEDVRDQARLEALEALQGSQIGIFKNAAGEVKFTIKNSLTRKTTVDSKKLREFYPDAWEATKKESAYTRVTYKAS